MKNILKILNGIKFFLKGDIYYTVLVSFILMKYQYGKLM